MSVPTDVTVGAQIDWEGEGGPTFTTEGGLQVTLYDSPENRETVIEQTPDSRGGRKAKHGSAHFKVRFK